jgi:hypothetical protein
MTAEDDQEDIREALLASEQFGQIPDDLLRKPRDQNHPASEAVWLSTTATATDLEQ